MKKSFSAQFSGGMAGLILGVFWGASSAFAAGTTPAPTPSPAPAPTALNMSCASDPAATTFSLATDGGQVHLSVYHNLGTSSVPINDGGIVTAGDVAQLTKTAQVLSQLGLVWKFDWNASDCEVSGPGLFQCENGLPTTINGVAVLPDSIYSSTYEQKWPGGISTKVYLVSLMFEISGQTYTIGLKYDQDDCGGIPQVAALRRGRASIRGNGTGGE